MRSIYRACRRALAAVAIAVAVVVPASAEEDIPAAAAWQEVISGQIQAFRERDAPAAFDYAGAAFKVSFQNAEIFFETIMQSGYEPIVDSRSHSFGTYEQVGTMVVLQQVTLVGSDLQLYGAIYQLIEEPEGWRVQGVQLYRQQGMAT
ncbi:MAG TPA: DUF4864 domain-containing protein [Devosiaceae bacterium]|jgi:hypothetical protein|nr:DUF4864 domain-containing protein [Devosiaceae bacterium]